MRMSERSATSCFKFSVEKKQALQVSPITHVARSHQAYPGSQYTLPSDNVEQERLILQHQILKTAFKNKLLFAPVDLRENDKVLDIGTGSGTVPGCWVSDLADSVEASVSIFGVDIEPRLFPTSHRKNIAFRVACATNLPADWTAAFSFVHQRLLILALQAAQWPVVLREIHRVLRPGGWVQLCEATAFIEGACPAKPCMEQIVAMYRRLLDARQLDDNCTAALPTMLAEAGFVDVGYESQRLPVGKWARELGVASRIDHVELFRGLKTPILEAGGYGKVSTEKEYDALIDGMEREWDDTPTPENPGVEREFVIMWARKPTV